MTINEITELRRNGDIEKAYEESVRMLSANHDDHDARVMTALCVKSLMERAAKSGDADSLVKFLGELASLHLEETGDAAINNKAAWDVRAVIYGWKDEAFDMDKVRALFDAVSQISFEKPHRYYSVLLDAFLKVRDAQGNPWADMPEMVTWWGLENLLPEDFERVRLTNGQMMPSLAERAYTACYKCLLAGIEAGEMRDEAESFIGDLEVLEETHPEFQYIQYQKTRILQALGHQDAALAAARAAVRRRRHDFWSWSLLGDIAENDADKIACYCRALTCRTDPGFLVKVRRKLAVMMYRAGFYANARREFEKIINIYDAKGWELPADVAGVAAQQWYEMTEPAMSNRGFYMTHAAKAEAFLSGDMPETAVLVTKFNPQKQTCSYATADRKRGFFSTKRMNERFADNQVYMVRFDGEPGGDKASNVLSCRRVMDVAQYDGIFFRQVEAELNLRPGMAFLFVDDIYVDGTLLRGHQGGDRVVITAVLYYNIKKESWGWRAIRLREAGV
jgi:hypothetical protein